MLIPAGALWGWDGVHPLHGCVCFSSKMTCNGHFPQTHSQSQLRVVGGGLRSDLCYKTCYKHMAGLDSTDHPDESLSLPLFHCSPSWAIPQVLTPYLTAENCWGLLMRGFVWLCSVGVYRRHRCLCLILKSFWGQLVNQLLQLMMCDAGCVTPSDLYQMGCCELRPLAVVK